MTGLESGRFDIPLNIVKRNIIDEIIAENASLGVLSTI